MLKNISTPWLFCLTLLISVSPGLQADIPDNILSLDSTSSSTTLYYRVVLPEGYEADNPDKRFPVIYLLHGKGARFFKQRFGFVAKTHAPYLQAVTDGVLREAILVYPYGGDLISMWGNLWPRKVCNGDCPEGHTSVDGNAYQIENTIIKELIPHIEANYHVLATRKNRAVVGFSMGGYGAMLYALKYPQKFGCAVSLDGALLTETAMKIRESDVYFTYFQGDTGYFDRYNIYQWLDKYANLIETRPNNTVKLRVVEGDLSTPFSDFATALNDHFIEFDEDTSIDDHSIEEVLANERRSSMAFVESCFP
jgi:S-formylglutathione hydrolase FrmB